MLATYADRAGICYPSQATISRGAGWSDVSSVKRGTRELKSAGYLEVTQRKQQSNLYEICFPASIQEGAVRPHQEVKTGLYGPPNGFRRGQGPNGTWNEADQGQGFLLPQHAKLIQESSIADDVAKARGYRSVVLASELSRYGFAASQRLAPGLLIPVYGVDGDLVLHMLRPDKPRKGENGKPLKYEFPAGTRMRLDVPPAARPQLGNPVVPLFITEGSRKVDAAVSRGLCCIALLGVWNWRGKNDHGGKVELADWEAVALNERHVYLVFDSDVVTKSEVALALERFKGFLERRGARPHVLYLPANGSGKVGFDDWLAAGGTVTELYGLTAPGVSR